MYWHRCSETTLPLKLLASHLPPITPSSAIYTLDHGHAEVPMYQPARALAMLKRFISGAQL